MTHSLHFRRCHVCGAVTERKDKIERCGGCGKSISPFFYFDEKTILVGETGGVLNLGQGSAKSARQEGKGNGNKGDKLSGEVRPVIGLSAYWPHEEDRPRIKAA